MSNKTNRLVPLAFTILLLFGIVALTIPAGSGAYASQSFQAGTATPTPVGADSNLYGTAVAPQGVVTQPYIILAAFGEIPPGVTVVIRGVLNQTDEFVCGSSPCQLALVLDSVISFRVYDSSGQVSPEYTATVRVAQAQGGYLVQVEGLTPIVSFMDSCSRVWNLAGGQFPTWARFVQSPLELATGETLHYLAGRLIAKKVVDASDCPNGGLAGTAPNGCGIERARMAMLEWQNRYDYDIWLAGKNVGIPPKLMKTLLLRESQFWPGNSRYFMAEFGLAQINDFGADVALRWNEDLYKEVCSSQLLLSDCATPYMARSPASRAMLRGALMSMLDSQCPSCDYGVDMAIAHASIDTIANILYANCRETSYVLLSNKVSASSYEDLWKMTMVNYHSGIYCLDTAVKAVADQKKPIDWAMLSPKLVCPGSKQYVDDFWASLTSFDSRVLAPESYQVASVESSPIPTPTVVPTPTPILSTGRLVVRVYVDKNSSNTPDPGEGVNGAVVQLTFSQGQVVFGVTDSKGEVVFNLAGREAGQTIAINLLGLYRRDTAVVPQSGDVQVYFKFSQPILPTSVP